LLHSALVLEKRGALISWTLLLSILTFSLSLIGTFLVRSGVLTSVHAFAVDPTRGGYVLAFTVIATGSALALYAWRAPAMRTGALFSPVSREAGMTLNNLFLVAATVTVFLGTFYPVFIDVIGDQTISVGPPYYALTFVPLCVPLLVVMGFGPMMNWKRDRITELVRRLRWPLGLGGLALAGGMVAFGLDKALAAVGIALGIWLIAASALVPVRRWKLGSRSVEASLAAIRTTPLAVWAVALAHLGIGVTAIGVSAMSAFGQDTVLRMTPGAVTSFAGRTITLDSLQPIVGPNYRADRATFSIAGGDGPAFLTSEQRFYPSSQDQTTEAGIGGTILGNLYVSVGERDPTGAVVVRMWHHPFVGWIWGGAVLMALGGAVSLSDRRLRLGAPSRAVAAAAPLVART
jgi:cytochrome c-type biogenesis protein CcmF